MKSRNPILSLEAAAIRADGKTAFEDIHWTIFPGQHWAMVGPTGSGKSLLLDALVRKRPLTAGRIRYFFDDNGQDDGPYEGRGYLYPDEIIRISPEASPLSNGRDAHFYQARWHSMAAGEWPAVSTYLAPENLARQNPYEVLPKTVDFSDRLTLRDKLLSRLGARHLLTRRLHQLSNGELRKVEIIRALMHSPTLLVVENPLAGLDAAARRTMQEILEELLGQAEISILLVDAGLDAIPSGITHVLCVSQGRVLKKGRRSEVLDDSALKSVFEPEAEPRAELLTALLPDAAFPAGNQRFNDAPLIEMHRVSLCYGGVNVLSNICWRMQPGEHWAVQGPNGAGKSSLASLVLADNPQAYANEIRLFGKDRGSGESIWEIKQHIGFVAPELQRAYRGAFTCRQVVCSGFFDSIGLYREPDKARAEAAEQWIRALHLDHLSDRFFRDVSEGEKRLVLIARALAKTPRLLVLDEPCSALDKSRCRRIIRVLDALAGRGLEQGSPHLLYITHQQAELPAAVTHVLRLENGRVASAGRRDQVLEGGFK